MEQQAVTAVRHEKKVRADLDQYLDWAEALEDIKLDVRPLSEDDPAYRWAENHPAECIRFMSWLAQSEDENTSRYANDYLKRHLELVS